ncbi:Protein mesh [Nymphon striatum]|nr:Protein mesh [Nymphon striatum]
MFVYRVYYVFRCLSSLIILNGRKDNHFEELFLRDLKHFLLISVTDTIGDGELADARSRLLYPINFTKNEYQNINYAQSVIKKSFGFRLPYYGFAYNYTMISTDGFIFFSDFMSYYSWPVKFPHPQWPNDNDPAMIAPFFADAAAGKSAILNPSRYGAQTKENLRPGVYYREVDLTSIKEGETPDREAVILKRRILADFALGIPGSETFVPEYALIVSWVGMTMRNSRSPKLVNTFQLVLITNQKYTYVMFNYHSINWISHFDNTLGKSGEAAFVGFNAGNGTLAYEFLPYSQNVLMRSLAHEGWGNGHTGRYYFHIDEEIFCGACLDPTKNPDMPETVRITANPQNGNMLGGALVNITGPCFDENTVIRCSFWDKVVPGYYVSKNRATCIQPRVDFYGYITISAAVGQNAFIFSDDYYIEPPELATAVISIEGSDDKLEKPETLTIKWTGSHLSTRPNTRLTLNFREGNQAAGLTYIDMLADEGSINNDDGKYTFSMSLFAERDNSDQLDMTFGFLRLNITDPKVINLKESPYIWSKPVPLAWYFWPQWESQTDDDDGYKAEKCKEWYRVEQQKNNFAFELPECPCTMAQAMADRGVFVPDQDCNIVDRKCDVLNQGAVHCVISGQPSMQGAGQQCCYDKFGELIHTNDMYSGGRPHRSFQYGQYPYSKREFVPTLSTWKYDVMPFLFCCKWDKKGDNSVQCQNFKKRRTSQDCVGYRSPAIASVYGDPHFVTFDGVTYTFNGVGEYTLMHINNDFAQMDVQGRFSQVMQNPFATFSSKKLPATSLMAVAAQSNASDSVEIYLRPPVARWRFHLSVYVGGRYIFFNSDALKMQSFKGVTVYVPEPINNQSQVNVMFHNGAGLEITELFGHLSVRLFVPFVFMNGTGGLLGTYTRDKNDEFMTPDKRITSVTASNTKDLYFNFGRLWQLTNANQQGKGSTLFNFGKVILILIFLNVQTCGKSKQCEYDYLVTQSRDIALASKLSENMIINLQSSSKTMVIRCPDLPTPTNGKKTSIKYIPGTNTRFVCNDGYRLIGTESRSCREDGLWVWGETAKCIFLNKLMPLSYARQHAHGGNETFYEKFRTSDELKQNLKGFRPPKLAYLFI